MVSAFYNLYARVPDRLSDTIQIGAFRVAVFQKHAGTEMHSIQPMLFQGFNQPVDSPSRATPTREECNHLRIHPIPLKAGFSFVEGFEAAHARAGLRDQVTANNGYLFRLCFSSHVCTTLSALTAGV